VRDQLRLKLVVPLLVVAVAGLAVAKFVVLKDDSSEAEAATPSAPAVDPAVPEPPAATGATETTTTGEEAADEPPAKNGGVIKLEKALKKNKVVVVVVYSPKGAVDEHQISEARSGAADVNAGFVALNAAKEKEVGEFAQLYEVRTTPIVLVFRRGPELVGRFETFADDLTVAQAAHNARQGR
jgi:hypothetical protein